MIEPFHELKSVLKQQGQSLTRPRQIVFKALIDKEPQTMRELVAICLGQVDRASVYRTIALFERLGIVQRLQIGWKYKLELVGAFHYHHHHLTCISCGKVLPFDEDSLIEERLKAVASNQHFAISGHQLEIQGLCDECQTPL